MAKHSSFKLSKVKASGVAIAMAIIIIGTAGAMAALFFIALTEPAEAVKCVGGRSYVVGSVVDNTAKNLPAGANKSLLVEDLKFEFLPSSGGVLYNPTRKIDIGQVTVTSTNVDLTGVVVSLRDQTNKLLASAPLRRKSRNSSYFITTLGGFNLQPILKMQANLSNVNFAKGASFKFSIKVIPGGGYLKCAPIMTVPVLVGPTFTKK